MDKKRVRYVPDPFGSEIEVGKSAKVYTLDHPNIPVDLQKVYVAHTSTVVRVEDDGEFETLNTVYIRAEEKNNG